MVKMVAVSNQLY